MDADLLMRRIILLKLFTKEFKKIVVDNYLCKVNSIRH
ncbi:hypothetical protein KNP414_01362 [Paenibacillus mucilaginosus KNP414]|uniref:Uncharacterized protein n=1 Tax=Paenibacillus mucilaginosus (strain KNP414) TaxID=1036673 RepID=F8FJG3_PAEMK|nr:hypothetical protein KNP414_01362 [Paenibacillus mucilaginosus KNP414]